MVKALKYISILCGVIVLFLMVYVSIFEPVIPTIKEWDNVMYFDRVKVVATITAILGMVLFMIADSIENGGTGRLDDR